MISEKRERQACGKRRLLFLFIYNFDYSILYNSVFVCFEFGKSEIDSSKTEFTRLGFGLNLRVYNFAYYFVKSRLLLPFWVIFIYCCFCFHFFFSFTTFFRRCQCIQLVFQFTMRKSGYEFGSGRVMQWFGWSQRNISGNESSGLYAFC